MDLVINKTDTVEQVALKLLQAVLLPILNNMMAQGCPDKAAEFFNRVVYGMGRARVEHVGQEYVDEMVAVITELDDDYFGGQAVHKTYLNELAMMRQGISIEPSQADKSQFMEINGKPS